MTEPLLSVTGIRAGYEEAVIGPISFAIEAGEILGLAGPNGSGKSTLLKAIGGKARIFDGHIASIPRLTIAWMEQQPVRLPEMPFDGFEYLRFAQADQTAPPGQMEKWLGQRIDSLSGGQFQLLACWTSLGCQAELIILDEPTNNLDIESEAVLENILLGDRGKRGMLIVSHDQSFLEKVCDRVLEVGP